MGNLKLFKPGNYNLNMKFSEIRVIVSIFLMFCLGSSVQAKLILPAVFTDNMVLQQKSKVEIWGKSEALKNVSLTASWTTRKYKVTADPLGNWKINIGTPSWGGPYAIHISDGEEITLKNVMIGDVWFCSGQSNMEFPMHGWTSVNNYEKELAEANYPNIRLLQATHVNSNLPLQNARIDNGGWKPCSSQNINEFSAVAYFFAREVYKKTGIPIGLIHSSWGGTVIEAWTSEQTIKTVPGFGPALVQLHQDTNREKLSFTREDANRPTALYNAMTHPFIHYKIKGVIWYQGENNASRAHQYRRLFPALIKDWRQKWRIGNFPFYFVQLANYAKGEGDMFSWPELRDAQRQTLSVANTGMAVSIDIGNPDDVHPKNKQDVGKRLALIALAKTYKQPVVYSGPVLQRYRISENKVILSFNFIEGGLQSRGGSLLNGFLIAGQDQKFYPAKGVIKGNQIIVNSAEVPHPVAVRYAWANNPICNLYNGAGLPASPFRTDQWKDSTDLL